MASTRALAQRSSISGAPQDRLPRHRPISNPASSLSSSSSLAAAFPRLQAHTMGAGQSSSSSSRLQSAGTTVSFWNWNKQAEQRPAAADESKAQVLRVYELNDLDRYSPAVLALSRSPYNAQAARLPPPADANSPPPLSIGDLVPFSNKVRVREHESLIALLRGLQLRRDAGCTSLKRSG